MLENIAAGFVVLLFVGIAVIGLYAAYQTDKIRARWERDGVDEHELRAGFYSAMRDRD
jgi:hypothetical protein